MIRATSGTVKASIPHWAKTYGVSQKEMERLFKEAQK
jgi:hypothetical protein